VNHWQAAVAAALLLSTAGIAFAQAKNCSSLPTFAQRPRPCNPQLECMRLMGRTLQPQNLDNARRACSHHPTAGTCYGPDQYNPQAECKAREGR